MTFDEYEPKAWDLAENERRAMSLAIYPDKGRNPIYPALGLGEEAGEVLGKIKKVLRDKGGAFADADRRAILLECGDVLWYLMAVAREMGSNLTEVMRLNLEKLEGRRARGTLGGSGDDR